MHILSIFAQNSSSIFIDYKEEGIWEKYVYKQVIASTSFALT